MQYGKDDQTNQTLPEVLGSMCDDMWQTSPGNTVNEIVCQGFIYDSDTDTFTFVGQQQKALISMTQLNKCNRPTSLLWILDAGKPS